METSSPKFNERDTVGLNYLNNLPKSEREFRKLKKYSGRTAKIASLGGIITGEYQYKVNTDADSPRSLFIVADCKFDSMESSKKLTWWESIKKYLLEW